MTNGDARLRAMAKDWAMRVKAGTAPGDRRLMEKLARKSGRELVVWWMRNVAPKMGAR